MARCARCAREIDDTLAVCPVCGLDQHRPTGDAAPSTGWGRFTERLVPYGDDDWSGGGRRGWGAAPRSGLNPRLYGTGILVIGAIIAVISFIVIVTVR